MHRDGKVCWTGFALTSITVAFVATATVLFTVFPKDSSDSARYFDPRNSVVAEGDEKTDRFDHRSHSVPGGIYVETDFQGKREIEVELDGSRSHTHYVDEGPPLVIGNIVNYVWFDNATHEVLATGKKPKIKFGVGTHVLGLTVADNTRDTQTDFTKVIIKGPFTPGVYCYHYRVTAINDDVRKGPRPDVAVETSGIDFKDAANFPSQVNNIPFASRCVFRTRVKSGDTFSFTRSGSIRFILEGKVLKASATSGNTETFTYVGPESTAKAQVIYKRSSGPALLQLTGKKRMLEYDVSKVVPVIIKVDPTSSTPEGGGKATISGLGLGNSVRVYFGSVVAPYEADDVSKDGKSLSVKVPKSIVDGTVSVDVYVENLNGESNRIPFLYSTDGKAPIKFTETTLTHKGDPYLLDQITGIKYGPDHRFYLSTYSSRITAIKVNQKMEVVGDICTSNYLGEYRVALGLAFNYASPSVRLYVSTSILYWKQKGYSDTWANGQIHMLEPNVKGACLGEIAGSPIITGLPVSNYDHGVNGLVFDDEGNLHIQVGGSTNAGFRNTKLGGQEESPLSGASLIAYVNKKPFDGRIKYSSIDPGTAKQTGGFDVKVFSSGWRNSFGINIHSNEFLYATDNGASQSFGDMSVSCTQNTKLPGTAFLYDKLGKVKRGRYFGHPNRNRGRRDARECKFQNHDAKESSHYQPPVAVLESSTNGVVEYTADTFGGQLKGNLFLSKYAAGDSTGQIFRVRLKANGEKYTEPDVIWEKSGLSIEMTPFGDLISPQIRPRADTTNKIVVLRPNVASHNVQTFRAVMPPRGSYLGGNEVIITGVNIGLEPRATFNGKECTNPKEVSASSFKCTVPPGEKGAKVKVAIVSRAGPPTESSNLEGSVGVDYKYMMV